MRYAFVIALLISLHTLAQPDHYTYKVYHTNEGSRNNTVYCMVRDSRGFIWSGTMDGLNRFDGHSFRHFFSDRNNPQSLTDNFIWDLLEYKPNKLLIATNDGVSVLNTITNEFENDLIKFPAFKRGAHVGVSSLFRSPDGNIWANHSGEIDVFDADLKWLYRFTDLPWAKALKGLEIRLEKWYLDGKQQLWLPTNNMGLCIANLAHKQVVCPGNNPAGYPFATNRAIRSFWLDEARQVLWYGNWGNALYKYNLTTKKLQQQLFNMPRMDEYRNANTIVLNKKGQLLCGVGSNLYVVDTATLAYKLFRNSNATDERPVAITCMKDPFGEIWFGGLGLIKAAQGDTSLKTLYLKDYGIDIGRTTQDNPVACRDILKAGNKYYFSYGTGGLVEFDPSANSIRQYKFAAGDTYTGKMCTIAPDKILISTSQGFKVFATNTHTWANEPLLNKTLEQHGQGGGYYGTRYLFNDSKGNLWTGVDPVGLVKYSPASSDINFIEDCRKLVNNLSIKEFPIHRIIEDNEGRIWFSSFHRGGILSYDPRLNSWTVYPQTRKYFNLLVDKGITKIIPAGNHQLWLGCTLGHGLMKYDYLRDTVSFVTRNDGLQSEFVQQIVKDRNGNLVLTTDKGLAYYNTTTGAISVQSLQEYGVSTEQLYVNYYDSSSNALFYGLENRLLVVSNNFVQPQKLPHKPIIDKLLVNGTPIPFGGGKLVWDHTQKHVDIDFATINFDDNSLLEYQYKLQGFDSKWKTLHQPATISYTNLLPGNYTLLLKAKHQAGHWGPVNNELQFSIRAALWQTAWFWALVALAGIGITVLLVWQRVHNIRKKAVLQQKVAEIEMQALRAQMNPHFIFNCLSAIDNLVQTNQREKATIYLGRFARLIRVVLDSLKHNTVPFQKDFESLHLYLQMEQFRCGNKFDFELNASAELLHSDYKVPPLIIQPFVENAVQHGLLNKQTGHRKLCIEAVLENELIKYTITDNGVGRIKAGELKQLNKPEHRSFGISIATERVHLFNKNEANDSVVITDLHENAEPTGTKIEVYLRVDNKNNLSHA